MNKRRIITTLTISALIIAIGAGIWFVFNRAAEPSHSTDQPAGVAPQTQAPVQQGVAGTYQPYSEAAVASTKANHRLLFFYAGWCPQCRMLEKSIEQTGVPMDIAIFKVDFDTAHSLRSKYEVTQQTTVVEIDTNGRSIKKIVAYYTPDLPAVLKDLNLQ